MTRVKIASIVLFSSVVLIACKNPEKEELPENDLVDEELALNEEAESEPENSLDQSLYVTAFTGLSLREYNNLHSRKLAVMPYGTKIRVITAEKNPTMTLEGIEGGMDQIEFNHKTGFAFNGYLSRFFPPELNISPRGYAQELNSFFPEVIYSETTGGTVSAPTNTEMLFIPTDKWHEAFFIAQRLFDFPKEFSFPKHYGDDQEIIRDHLPKKGVWISELHVYRKDDHLQKIEYLYQSNGYESVVSITGENDGMLLKKTEKVY